ncbi:hypothetical protein TRAPUB_2007 [Trametes pubescens]|uniref:Uncharacterized protein n=1 Tax=Trametes pubescens TaxID=154538 RepID=A0A1M2VHT2_TRAPU|nr:hypothetical protein TRAPUB_2007 [Trametes pubescens]
MAMGIRRPGYQLLSLIPPTAFPETQTIAHTPCLLPDQLGIYLSVYVPLIVLSLAILLLSNIRRSCTRHSSPTVRSSEWTSLDPADAAEPDYDLPPPSAWRSKEFPRPGWSSTPSRGLFLSLDRAIPQRHVEVSRLFCHYCPEN